MVSGVLTVLVREPIYLYLMSTLFFDIQYRIGKLEKPGK